MIRKDFYLTQTEIKDLKKLCKKKDKKMSELIRKAIDEFIQNEM